MTVIEMVELLSKCDQALDVKFGIGAELMVVDDVRQGEHRPAVTPDMLQAKWER